ncbi:MAG: Enolase [Candidatus Roizmanbacteria bacterium GW2011_GWC2_37_13]|uniref:Enolase n=1 Tax=Candidatus Roizmanbacteria bacterium GW2011_GWC2_37_13 TaxID=1618486 RepID=A0A0G0G296_9BACT|nr:MAG: Enolase [Candidatus Roizmanbacteria bacterium GW2011_GWC1_37_12]KKQ25318.1 MAG: Enolase [Candidatus Roizmanbacteria bacterium GW2011_GWC2_37_13]
MKINKIKAIEILDSRGNPTLRTFVVLDDGTVASSSVPSGASTGSHEAVELRDQDPKRYHGLGVLKAVNNVNDIIAPKLVNLSLERLDELDRLMIDLDGTENKSRLGANAILSVSQAAVKAAALSQKIPIWQFINEYYFQVVKPSMPKMMFNVVNGGKHADWNFDIQEFIIIPQTNKSTDSVRIGSEIYHSIQKNLKEKKLSILVGDEGGFSPALNSNEEAFQLIIESAKQTGYGNEKDYKLGIDAAASEFFSENKYILKKDNKEITGEELIQYYLEIKDKYLVYSFEDVFQEDDWENWSKFFQQAPSLLIGDDLFCTNINRMKTGYEKKSANAVIIKPNQIGTVKETIDAIKLAKEYGWATAVSHRSGETEDSFLADLAYGAGVDFIKTGSISRSERLAKYNRLIEIENGL